jgi:genome maintenance exonuclease 1
MPDLHLLPSYSIRSVRQAGKSYFVDSQGNYFPSVTTILNATKPAADRLALMQWRDRVGTETAQKITGNASRRGSQTHKQIKHYLLNQPLPIREIVQPYWDSLLPVLEQLHQVRLVESGVFHTDLGYAGKVDCIASYQGMPCLLDWKTADRPKGSIDRLYDAPLQLAAYWGAANYCYGDQEMDLKAAAIVVAVPGQAAELFWLDLDLLLSLWQVWQNRVKQYYRMNGIW